MGIDGGLRDLSQIEEGEIDAPRRQLLTLLLAAAVTVGLVMGMGALLGRSAAPEAEPTDPLRALDRAAGLSPEPEALAPEPPIEDVDRTRLRFPQALAEYDSRPEVEAAIAAAAAELEHLGPAPDAPGLPFPAPGLPAAPAPTGGPIAELPPPLPALPTSLPAAIAAGGQGERIARAIAEDPMVAAAVPAAPQGTPAREGREGRYTLQVSSYQNAPDAEALASGLRARGHEAFVVTADIPGRGMHWRVRIGPFDTRRAADSYRSAFETEERMNTYVVRRREPRDQPTPARG